MNIHTPCTVSVCGNKLVTRNHGPFIIMKTNIDLLGSISSAMFLSIIPLSHYYELTVKGLFVVTSWVQLWQVLSCGATQGHIWHCISHRG